MSKRQPQTILTRDNWEDELEPEEAGVFQVASEEALQNRVIKKARRRNVETESKCGIAKSPFLKFGGFVKTESIPTFSFANNTKPSTTNGTSPSVVEVTTAEKKKVAPTERVNSRDEYYKQLKCLNECFQQWILKYLAESPYCNFIPVCRDYEKHVQELARKFPERDCDHAVPEPEVIPKEPQTLHSKPVSSREAVAENNEAKTFTFGSVTPAEDKSHTKLISAESSLSKPEEPSKSFSFVAVKATSANSEEKDECVVEDEDQPPKTEFTPVEESDSFYSQRCKLFCKKDKSFVDKGVGVLYLKKAESKTQLIIRANTNLGNILLNIILNKSIPIQRMGKNNVAVVCFPNPPVSSDAEPEPTQMLIRVKTSEDADRLYSKLVEHAT